MARKKILIISYYYPPANCVAALRPNSFATYLSAYYDIKVITRHWEGNEKKWEDYLASNLTDQNTVEINKHLEVTYLPYKDARKKENKLRTLLDVIKGKLDYDYDCLQFKDTATSIISQWNPDLLLVSAPPNNLVNLAHYLNKKWNLPFIVDFRDFENNILLNKQSNNSFKSNLLHNFTSFHVIKKIKNASLVISVNDVFNQYFKQKGIKNTRTIFNGFESELFKDFELHQQKSNFEISIIGTLYPQQDINTMIDGILLFLKTNKNTKFNFIGTDVIEEVGQHIKYKLNHPSCIISSRIQRKEVLEIMKSSDVLIYMGWRGFKGVYSSKIFEYLGAKRNILIAPSDEDVIEALLKETKAGVVANTPDEVCAYFNKKYEEWEKYGFLNYDGIIEKINFYSRENQSNILHKEIEKLLQ